MSRTLPLMGEQFKQNSVRNVKPLEPYPTRNLCGIVGSRSLYKEVIEHAADRTIVELIFARTSFASHRDAPLSLG
ncbi:MAG: hypothetical protein H8K03_13535 [Nitrospira sp.]|nr:hypothetical protein [Nitrospira sp. BO4]